MRKFIILFLVLVLLLGGLGTAAFAGYNGYGLVSSSEPNARGGSTGGIFFLGGGPSSGK